MQTNGYVGSQGASGRTVTIKWAWNTHETIAFNAATDRIDFGWFSASNFTVTETDAGVVIAIPSNSQTYTLTGVRLADLSMEQIVALDATAHDALSETIANAAPVDEAPDDPQEPQDPEEPVDPPIDPADPIDPEEPVDPETPVDPVDAPLMVGYFPEWAIYDRNFQLSDVPADQLTHLVYAFSRINEQGRMALFDTYAAVEKRFSAQESVDGVADTWDQPLAGNFHQLAELKAANPDLSVLIAVGGWTLSGPFSDVAATEQGRANFADSVVEFLQTYPMFDGVDFDWEYPGGGGLESNTVRPQDGVNYALLLAEVRDHLDALEQQTGRQYEISVASPAGSDKIDNFNLEGLAQYVDFFNLMAYDFHGGWESTTGHQAPLYDTIGGNYDIDTAVQRYLDAGIDPSTIVLGAPAYTRAWSGVQAGDDGGWNAPSTGLAPGTWERGVYDYKDLVNKILDPASDWAVYWDDNAQAAYAYSPGQGIYSTLETPASIALKAEWAAAKGLGGMMFWDLSGDTARAPEGLLNAAFQSWVQGKSLEEIAGQSALTPDVVIGGNGLLDSVASDAGAPPDDEDEETTPPDGNPGPQDPDPGEHGDGDPDDGGLDPDTGLAETVSITWNWGSTQTVDFDPATDMLDFGWMGASNFQLSEQPQGVVIEIVGNNQTYVLQGVSADSLGLQNVRTLDPSAAAEWSAFLGG